MTYAEAGKGSAPRKAQDQEAYSTGWDRIFGKKHEDQNQDQKASQPDGNSCGETQSGEAQG